MPASSFQHPAHDHNDQSKDQDRRKDYVGKDSEIRVLSSRGYLDQEQQHDAYQRSAENGGAHETDVVSKKTRYFWFLVFDFAHVYFYPRFSSCPSLSCICS